MALGTALTRRGLAGTAVAGAAAAHLALSTLPAAADTPASALRPGAASGLGSSWAAVGVGQAPSRADADLLNPLAYLGRLDEALKPRLGYPTDRDVPVRAWQEDVRPLLAAQLGTFPVAGPEPPAARQVEVRQREGLEQRLVYLEGAGGQIIPVYVLIPTDRPGGLPVIVALHGHGGGAVDLLGTPPDWQSGKEAEEEGLPFAPDLARGGAIVLVPEQFGFGMRRHPDDIARRPPRWDSSARLAGPLLHLEQTLLGLRLWEARRIIDYALSRPTGLEALNLSVGLVGFSGGATVALFTAALDPRVAAAVVSGYYCDWSWSILSRYHNPDNYVPGLRSLVEVSDVAGLVTPRALFLETGEQDDSFPIEGFWEAVEPLQRIYERASAASQLRHSVHGGGHQFDGRVSLPWLLGTLGAAAAPSA